MGKPVLQGASSIVISTCILYTCSTCNMHCLQLVACTGMHMYVHVNTVLSYQNRDSEIVATCNMHMLICILVHVLYTCTLHFLEDSL